MTLQQIKKGLISQSILKRDHYPEWSGLIVGITFPKIWVEEDMMRSQAGRAWRQGEAQFNTKKLFQY